jgi:DNA-binding MarR family transcriptional regulator
MAEPRLPDSTRAFGDAEEVMTVPQLRTLVELKTHGAKSTSSLASALRLPESRIMRACARLVVSGHVIHVPGTTKDGDAVVALSTAGGLVADDLVECPRGTRRQLRVLRRTDR